MVGIDQKGKFLSKEIFTYVKDWLSFVVRSRSRVLSGGSVVLFSAFVFVVSYTFAYTLTHYHGSRSKVTGLCLARSPSPVYMQMDGCMNRKTMVSGLCCIALQDENLFYFISSFTFFRTFPVSLCLSFLLGWTKAK